MTTRHSNQPTDRLLKAWQLIKQRSHFITPAEVAKAAQVNHDVAAEYLREWLEHGVLEPMPRYPKYVYARTMRWRTTAIARRLNQMSELH